MSWWQGLQCNGERRGGANPETRSQEMALRQEETVQGIGHHEEGAGLSELPKILGPKHLQGKCPASCG